MNPEELLFEEAMQAIQNNDFPRARELLVRLIQKDRTNPRYWVWMSGAVESVKEREYCLREALKLDPTNQAAIQGLRLLGIEVGSAAATPIKPPPKVEWKTSLDVEKPLKPASIRKTSKRTWIGLGVVSTALIVLLIVLANANRYRPDTSPILRFSLTPPATATPKQTPTPLWTGPAPLWSLLNATYTPTPIYAATPHKLAEAYTIAMRAYANQEWSKALEYFQQALAAEPGAVDIQYHIAEVYRFQGLTAEAIKAYDAAILLNPDFAPAHLGKGQTLLIIATPSPEKARQQYKKALELDPGYLEAKLALADLTLLMGDAEGALTQLIAIESESPLNAAGELIRARAYLHQGDTTNALSAVEKSLQMDITNLEAYLVKAAVLQTDYQYDTSRVPLDTYLTYRPDDPEALALTSRTLAAQGDLGAALQSAEKALSIDATSISALLVRGEIYLQQEIWDKASTDFNAVIRLKKDSFEATLGIAQVQLGRKLYTSASEYARVALQLAHTDLQMIPGLYWQAMAWSREDNFQDAVENLKKLLTYPESLFPPGLREKAEASFIEWITPTPTINPSQASTEAPVLNPSLTPTPRK